MLGMNFVGKPCAGKPLARFDEGDRLKDTSKEYTSEIWENNYLIYKWNI